MYIYCENIESKNIAVNLPKISIVVPAFNEATMLPLCLDAIQKQDYKGDFEVIIADNASTDNTVRIAQKFNAKVVYEKRRGAVYARITGFNAATGEIIASTDADTLVPIDWLTSIEIALRDQNYAGIVGAYELNNTNTFSKKLVGSFVPYLRFIDKLVGAHFAGANFAVRRLAYIEVGGFDPSFITGEDLELSRRLRDCGFELKVDYKICVKTSARRLNEGLWPTMNEYVFKNWLSLVIFHRSYLKVLSVVRESPSELTDIE